MNQVLPCDWLPVQAILSYLVCRVQILVPSLPHSTSFVDQAWPARYWNILNLRIFMGKRRNKRNFANIQPIWSGPHACSISHKSYHYTIYKRYGCISSLNSTTTVTLRRYVFIFQFYIYFILGSVMVGIVYRNLHEELISTENNR